MKHCFFISVFYVALAFYGETNTVSQGESIIFQESLSKYIKERMSSAKTALGAKKWGLGAFVDWGSYFSSMGNSVDENELRLFTGYTDTDYKEAIGLQNCVEIEQFAQKAYEAIKYEKDANKWHDHLYEVISKYNSEKLFHDKNLPRAVAMKKMLENKNDINVKKQFVFGIAVTKAVEEMMKKK